MDQEFQAAFKALNASQKQAVETIDGPVMVIAGPGTGKTQLLSLRVANILRRTDTDPASILCLTFTNFAATNMRQRLVKLVGNQAHSLMVGTFHSFAAEIMQQHPDYFWNGARLSIVPDAVQLDLIEDILSSLALNDPLAIKFADSFSALNDVKEALGLTKEAGLTPAKLESMIKLNQAYLDIIEPKLVKLLTPTLSIKRLDTLRKQVNQLPDQPIDSLIAPLSSLSSVIKSSLELAIEADQATGKTLETSKWKQRWVQSSDNQKAMLAERRRNDWWLSLAKVYQLYRARLQARSYYDYADMIVEVISTLEQKPELLSEVRERYQYVLIDEFQDTNAAQLRLAHLVASSPVSADQPNLMIVGDDDQAIFAFNGAELNNMLAFQRTYPKTKTIVLKDNYRSTSAVLKTAESIISQADERLVSRLKLTKQLKPQSKTRPGQIKHYLYPTREVEISEVAKLIKSDWQNDPSQQLAVLARTHHSLKRLASQLNQSDVAISYEQQNNVLDLDLIQQLRHLAEAVVAINAGDLEQVNYHLSLLLAGPAWQLDPRQLWQLAVANHHAGSDWLASLSSSSNKTLVNLANWLMWLASAATNQPLSVMLDYLLGLRAGEYMTSPLRQHYLSSRPVSNAYLEALSGLNSLQQLVEEYTAVSTSSLRLKDFVRFIRLNQELGRSVVDSSWFVSSDQAVQLMTVHKAKGLEFDTVYLLDAVEADWRPRRIGRKPPANLPLEAYGEHYDDYVRLAYVAATRSRRSFIVSSFSRDANNQPVLASPLFRSLETEDLSQLSKDAKRRYLETSLSWPRLETSDQKALLGPRLSSFQLSATGLLQFLDVSSGGPQRFLETQLLRLPGLTTANMAYGTAMHYGLQVAQSLVNQDQFSLKKVLAAYELKLASQPLPNQTQTRWLEHGQMILNNLFKHSGFKLAKGAKAEVIVNDLSLGAARIGGKLDNVELKDNQIMISDYKTGTPLPSFDTKAKNQAIKAWRHRQQLTFYCLLASQSHNFKNIKNFSAQDIYVEAEDAKHLKLSFEPSPEELERLTKLISIVWQHTQELDLPDISHYPATADGIRAFEADLLS